MGYIIFFLCSILFSTPIFADDFNLLLLSDIHLGAKNTMDLAPIGADDENDLDIPTYHYLLNQISGLINQNIIKPDMAVITGDFINHQDSLSGIDGYDARDDELKENFSSLKQQLSINNMPMAFAFGNNDSLAGHYKSFYTKNAKAEHSPFESALHEGWSGGFLSTNANCDSGNICINQNEEHVKKGYYAVELKDGLKLLVLNSVPFHISKSCHHTCQKELTWLDDELKSAMNNHQVVLLAMHIPPGKGYYQEASFWNPVALNHFVSSMHQYANNIIGIIAGHTHMDELHMIKTDGKPIIPIIYAPALSTSHGNLPAFKMLSLKRINNKWDIVNYQTYHYYHNQFMLFYQFKDNGLNDAVVKSLPDYLASMIKNNQTTNLLNDIKNHYTLGNEYYQPSGMPEVANLFLD